MAARRTVAAKPCTPVPHDGFSPWPQPGRPCRFCGTPMHATAAGPADWRWAAVDGSSKGIADDAPPLYVQDPGAWWDGLRELMRSGNKAHSTRAAQIYSSTKAFMDIYGIEPWAHHHYPEDAPGGTGSGRRCPDCCERPMHAQPRGWACRVTGRTVPYARRES